MPYSIVNDWIGASARLRGGRRKNMQAIKSESEESHHYLPRAREAGIKDKQATNTVHCRDSDQDCKSSLFKVFVAYLAGV